MFPFNYFRKRNNSVDFNNTNQTDWCLILVNKHVINNSTNTREIDLYSKQDLLQLKIANTDQQGNILNYHHVIDKIIASRLSYLGSKLNDAKTINPLNLDSEEKSLEWIKVSFQILKNAILSKTSDEIQYSFSFYMGVNPQSELFEIRLIIFNLDIQYVLLNDGNLRIRIYNDENKGSGSSLTPALKGDFSKRKREMHDELIQLFIALKDFIHF